MMRSRCFRRHTQTRSNLAPPLGGSVVRNIMVKGTQQRSGVSFETIRDGWKEDGFDLTELKTTPDTLAELVSRADRVIQRVYADAGQPVQVEHGIEILPPLNRYVEIRFTVTPAAIPK
jgi:hypothetical protein